MELCARCKKRMAVVFVTRIENGETINEGICLKCARELGIKPVNDIIEKMGLSDDDLEVMDSEMENMMEMLSSDSESETDDDNGDEFEEGRAPAFDLRKMFGAFPVSNNSNKPVEKKDKEEKTESGTDKKTKDKKD